MPTIKELREKTMTPEKAAADKHDIFAFYIGRPMTYALTLPFLKLGIKANTVSFLSIFPSLLGFLLLGFGQSTLIKVIGSLMFFLWSMLDGVDGNIARFTETASKMGVLWDATAGYIAMSLMYFAMGVSMMTSSEQLIPLQLLPDYYYIVFSGLTSISTLFSRLVMHKKMVLFSKESSVGLNEKANYSMVQTIALNLTSPSGAIQVFMIIAICARLINIFVIGYFIIHFIIMVVSVIKLLRE